MTFNHFNRRLHLYLAMALVPWFLMYSLSSLMFNHPAIGKALSNEGPDWKPRFEARPYDGQIDASADPDALRKFGAQVLRDVDEDCAYGAWLRDGKINVYCHSFLSTTSFTYHIENKTLKADDRIFEWTHFIGGLHERGGYQQDSFLDDLWAFMVDLVCVGFIVWVASGLYMWWKLPRLRRWGSVALACGLGTFLLFLWGL